jgi:hypothetical protein
MNVRRLTSSGTVAIAAVALVIGLTAPALAHEANVVAHKISGSDLKKNSVTGKQIKESTLATVPSATNARKLGGKPASAYARATTATASGLVKIPYGGTHTVFTRYPLTWVATCTKGSGTTNIFTLSIKAAEDVDFTQQETGLGDLLGKGKTMEIDNAANTGSQQAVLNYTVTGRDGAHYSGMFSAGLNVEGVPCGMSVTAIG